jgi:16S rRNA (guanine966-N2)-methyltransferase
MRIISGSLGGRTFEAPKGNKTHPMSDKVRGALFNAMGDLSDLTVLDAFGGSGALGLEAMSRGAAHGTIIESDRSAQTTIAKNIESLGLSDRLQLRRMSVTKWLDEDVDGRYHVILADPPYDHLKLEVLNLLPKRLKQFGVLVLSWPGKLAAPVLDGLQQVSRKSYGDAQLVFYKQVP